MLQSPVQQQPRGLSHSWHRVSVLLLLGMNTHRKMLRGEEVSSHKHCTVLTTHTNKTPYSGNLLFPREFTRSFFTNSC